MNKILIIGSVWPEPNSSAAGMRMLQLIQLFLSHKWTITFASAASESDHMHDIESLGVKKATILINDNSFDNFLLSLQPNIVLFDRFMTEEQFGWRVSKQLPRALKVLNTEDLHSLRKSRQEIFKNKKTFNFLDVKKNDITKREISSIYRCDQSLIISDTEIDFLKTEFEIPQNIVYYLPFLLDPINIESKKNWPSYEDRNHFITIGNFRHEPNWNSVLYLKETIWPLIKKELPAAELHIYGAYPPPKATQLYNEKQGFLVKGWAKDSKEVMKKAKVCLAPLRFGAGIKGKLAEAMLCGTPSITTQIGSEGMLNDDTDWNGFIKDDPEEFAKAAVALYNNRSTWHQAQQNGIEIINSRFNKDNLSAPFIKSIKSIQKNLDNHRASNFIGSMLQYHTIRSTEFMSRWIEEKNKNN